MGARLFTAVVPPASVMEDLDAFLEPRRRAETRLRWTRPEGWHLTTAFMADVADRHLDRLSEGLQAAALRTPAFTLTLAGGGAFPWPLETKNLWLGVTEGADALTRLAERCRNAASHAGIQVDGARFVPHLTLARAGRPLDSTRLLRVLDTYQAPPFEVTELALIASHLRDRAHRYEILETFGLSTGG
ncbi:MAG: RNA 2',3'-cyclic phosphodiesterase [Propioniciclava sp.]|uniref:RNA 2',3'-cyclic phosphodiesterase n=1 Tax=Propioniciclava sp. TaxID=2038686 RepID=UPI0039E26F4A